MAITTLIETAFQNLNYKNNGKTKFELFCQHLISVVIDPQFLPSTGTDA